MAETFWRMAQMAAGEQEAKLYVEGLINPEKPWWDIYGESCAPENFRAAMAEADGVPLKVYVNSYGGDAAAGVCIANMLAERKQPTTCVTINAMSAASLILCGCNESLIVHGGVIMIHNPMVGVEGDHRELARGLNYLAVLKESVIGLYQKRLKMTREEITAKMDEEAYFAPQAAIECGFADGMYQDNADAPQMATSLRAWMQASNEATERMMRSAMAGGVPDAERQEMLAWLKTI